MKEKEKEFPPQSQNPPGSQKQMKPQPETIRQYYKSNDRLKGKVALISGGDSGIGRSVAVHFAREGADIAIIYKNEEQDAQKTKELVEKEGQKCILFAGDVGDRDFCKQTVESTAAEYGKINILINNAGEQHPADNLEQLDLDLMERTFRTNVFGLFYLTKFVIDYMDEGDSIINSTSVTSFRGSSHLLDYSATKGAITAFTRSLSKNLAGRGIRVNGVAPGPIWTPLIVSTFNDVTEFGADTPMKRAGQPSEVSPAYVFLASEDASYITGQIIHPNGGDFVGT